MPGFSKILFPFDFSDAAKAMAPIVNDLAHRFGASVTLLNAFNLVRNYHLEPSIDPRGALEPEAIPYTPALQTLRDRREEGLSEFARSQFSEVESTTTVHDGDPSAVIAWFANRDQSDLIMMPTRGLGRFRRLLLGSVTAKVIHDVDCPVFTSTHEPDSSLASPGGYQSIVCATRFDPESESALKMARFLADAFHARVCLLYIRPPSDAGRERDAKQFIRRSFEQTEQCGGESGGTSVRILEAAVPEAIRQTAIEENADLVIVGRGHSREDISCAWSSVYTIIRESPCPVLTV